MEGVHGSTYGRRVSIGNWIDHDCKISPRRMNVDPPNRRSTAMSARFLHVPTTASGEWGMVLSWSTCTQQCPRSILFISAQNCNINTVDSGALLIVSASMIVRCWGSDRTVVRSNHPALPTTESHPLAGTADDVHAELTLTRTLLILEPLPACRSCFLLMKSCPTPT